MSSLWPPISGSHFPGHIRDETGTIGTWHLEGSTLGPLPCWVVPAPPPPGLAQSTCQCSGIAEERLRQASQVDLGGGGAVQRHRRWEAQAGITGRPQGGGQCSGIAGERLRQASQVDLREGGQCSTAEPVLPFSHKLVCMKSPCWPCMNSLTPPSTDWELWLLVRLWLLTSYYETTQEPFMIKFR